MTRRQWLGGTAAAAVAAQTPKTNIVLIVADDLGYADLGATGDPSVHTPHIDSLARDGVRFTDFSVSWPACTPSRSSILTGRYPQRNGLYDMIRNNEVNWKFQFDEQTYSTSPEMTLGLDTRETTIGQVMQSAGYATGVIGKWDSGRARRFLPSQRGFDFFYGFANTGIDYYTHQRYGVASMFRGNQRITEEGHATDLFAREARQFIGGHRDRPFFLYLPFNAPHGASTFDKTAPQEPEQYLKRYAGDRRALYKAMITHLDDAVGSVLAELRSHGLEDNTLVVFSSDNGGTGKQNGPFRGGKATLWEGGVRVPLLARWPGRIKPGTVSREWMASVDFLPTFAAVAAAREPAVKLDGFNQLAVFEGKAKSPRREQFWQRLGDRSARHGPWKWLRLANGEGGLFDLTKDPGETTDLTAKMPEVARDMEARWNRWRKEMDATEPRGPFRDY